MDYDIEVVSTPYHVALDKSSTFWSDLIYGIRCPVCFLF